MATKYFSDATDGAVELTAITSISNAEFAARFPGVRGIRLDGYEMIVGRANGSLLPATRRVNYKSQPSRHECNAKCLGGKHDGACECSCGGKNHGRGMFTALIAEAA